MNAVWNSYGQLCGCPEIFKKSCKFFCRELDIRVSEIMKSDVRQSSVFQNFLMQVHNGIGVVHPPCDGRWEHIWVVGMLLVFGNQQVNSLLWNTDLSDRCLRFGARECQLPIGVLDILLADGDGFVRDVEVTPQEGSQLTLA